MMPLRSRCAIFGISLMLLWSLTASAAVHYTARVNYILNCQGCHLVDGAGTPGKVPALKDEIGRFLQVEGGREYLVRVPGTSQSPLSDAEVAGVLNWILHNFSPAQLPDDFRQFTSQEVAGYRYRPLANAGAVRQRLITAISRLQNTPKRP